MKQARRFYVTAKNPGANIPASLLPESDKVIE
jgi:hypothetical protein